MYIVFDTLSGDNIGPFDSAEDATYFIAYCEEVQFPGADAMEIQTLQHPQDFVLDNDLEREREHAL